MVSDGDEDHRLLAAYVRNGSQDAFAALVARHVDLVYSTARRRLGGDAHLAEDVTQAVFLLLARKASSIGRRVVIGGWLFNASRLIASNAAKARQRQARRERVASESMPVATVDPHDDWAAVAPHLESAMDRLGRGERDAVLLRFYRGMSLKEVAAATGVSEDAATQRVSRGVAKLRAYFASRGVSTTGDALTMSVSANAVTAAPIAAKAAAGAAITAAGAAATSLANGAIKTMTWANVKVAAGVAAVLAITSVAGVASYNEVAATTTTSRPARQAAAVAPVRASASTAATPASTAPAATRPVTQRLRTLLDTKLPDLNFAAIPAGDVFDFLRDVTGANIVVNWRSLEALRAPRTRPITLRLTGRTFAQALDGVTAQLGEEVAWRADTDLIMVGERTQEPAATLVTVPDAPERDAMLGRRLPEVKFDAVPLADALAHLEEVGSTKIGADWESLARIGLTKKTLVTIRLRDVPLVTGLQQMLHSLPTRPPGAGVDHTVSGFAIVVADYRATPAASRPARAPARR